MHNVHNTRRLQPAGECAAQRLSEALVKAESGTATASVVNPESHFLCIDKSSHTAHSQPADLSLKERLAETCTVDKTSHTPQPPPVSGQSQRKQPSASCPATAAAPKPLPDEIIMDTIARFDETPPDRRISIEDLNIFRLEIYEINNQLNKFETDCLKVNIDEIDDLKLHSSIYSNQALLKRLTIKYHALKNNTYKIVDQFNRLRLPSLEHKKEFSKHLFLSDDMFYVTSCLAHCYRILNRIISRSFFGKHSHAKHYMSYLIQSIACNLSDIRCIMESEFRKDDVKSSIAYRSPVTPEIRKYHTISHTQPRELLQPVPCEPDSLNAVICNLLTTIATASLEINTTTESPDKRNHQNIVTTAAGFLFSSIDQYREGGSDQKFQPACAFQHIIGQHLFCADLFHAALVAGRWDAVSEACETTSRIVFQREYSLEPVIQRLNQPAAEEIDINQWHRDFEKYTESRYYPLYLYFSLGLEAASIYLSTLLAHKESPTENQLPLNMIRKTEELQQILDTLTPWSVQLQKLGLLNNIVESSNFYHRLALAEKRIAMLTDHHKADIIKSFDEEEKSIMQHTATDGANHNNPQQLSEYLKSRLTQLLIHNDDIIKFFNKACDAYNPGISVSELDEESCQWLIETFTNNPQSPHTELLLTFSHCSYYCTVLVEFICQCASISSDLKACLTSIPVTEPLPSLKMTKDKWKEKIKANGIEISHKMSKFDNITQKIKTCFNSVLRFFNKIREPASYDQDICLKIVLFESIHATLLHCLQQIQGLSSALVKISTTRMDVLKNEFPTIANLEQTTVSCRNKLQKNINLTEGCVKELNISKKLSLAKKTTVSPARMHNGQPTKQALNKPDALANLAANIPLSSDTADTLASRNYFHEQIASVVQALIKDGKPVAYLGSRAYQAQVLSRWGSKAFELAKSSGLLSSQIRQGVFDRSITPRDTDLLVVNNTQFSDVKKRIHAHFEKAARKNNFLPDACQLDTTNDAKAVYYGKECHYCNLILRYKHGYTKNYWVYVVDLITPVNSAPSTLLPYDFPELALGNPTHARPLDTIMIDECKLAVGLAAGPVRALMAITRINIVAALESIEPKLEPASVIVLVHVLERLQDNYPDQALGKLAKTLRSRVFNTNSTC
ncbi:hypothetical protein [Endozoicomonas sp. ONNA2]|uniref:hypothetical protein n=1 Tax=Endozoicomonas sp. ONNA2 TaxID=2828741 RepID=UPI00214869D2|nr:hypothetical protein [Endozoicomonas sp. ONNA2]